jgi:hypothetical protein
MLLRQFLFLFLFIVGLAFPIMGQETDSLIFMIQDMDEPVLLNKFWKYQPGDDTIWATSGYDDSHWDTLSTRLNLIQLGDSVFTGRCWFRLHIRIDSSLRHETFALLMDQQGASEVYLDGKRINSFGTIIDSLGQENI